MAILGTVIIIFILAFLVWWFMMKMFNKIGNAVFNHIENAVKENTENNEEEENK